MTCARFTSLILLALMLASCGDSSRPPKKIDGVWYAQLNNTDGTAAYTFSATLTQGTGSDVTVTAFGLWVSAPACFSSSTGQTATFTATGRSGGYQTGPFAMNISTAFMTQIENVIAMTGTRNSDGTITGNWTLTGLSGCSGSGSYSMHILPAL